MVRSRHLLEHAGLPGRRVVGHAGGPHVPAVPQRAAGHARAQVLPRLQPVEMAAACAAQTAGFC